MLLKCLGLLGCDRCVRRLVSLSWGRKACQEMSVRTSGSYKMCQDAGRSVRELVCKVSKCHYVRWLWIVTEVKKCLMGPLCLLENVYSVRGFKSMSWAGSVSLPALSPCSASWQSSLYRRGWMLGKSTPWNRGNTRVKTKHQGHWSNMVQTKCNGHWSTIVQPKCNGLNKTWLSRPNT